MDEVDKLERELKKEKLGGDKGMVCMWGGGIMVEM